MRERTIQLDETDWRIIRALRENARATFTEIGRAVGLTSPAARERVRRMEEAGLTIAGVSPDGRLVEAVEDPSCRFFVGVQYHPEFKSRPNRPHPLFVGFIRAFSAQPLPSSANALTTLQGHANAVSRRL